MTSRAEEQTMSPTHAAAPPHRSVDARGRALALSPEEARLRAEEGLRALDAIAAAAGPGEDQAADLDELLRALDEDRTSDRRRSGS
jgi:hypothetical protein